MKFGFVVPWGDAEDIGDLAAAAESAGWDGVIPQVLEPDGGARQPHLDEVAELRSALDEHRPGGHIDIIVEGTVTEHSPAAYADTGATWWIESMWDAIAEHSPVAAAHDRLLEGPPA